MFFQITSQSRLWKCPTNGASSCLAIRDCCERRLDISCSDYRLMLHIVRELEEYPVLKVADGIIVEPRSLCSYLLFSTQRDFVVADTKIERGRVERDLQHDPILHPSAGPEWTDQLRAWEPIAE